MQINLKRIIVASMYPTSINFESNGRNIMTTPNELQQLEKQIKDNKKTVELYQSLERLKSNRDFRKLIQEGYLENEAVRLVQLKADPAHDSPVQQAKILRDIDSIGSLASYFQTVATFGRQAEKQLSDAEATLVELLEESNND